MLRTVAEIDPPYVPPSWQAERRMIDQSGSIV
jgi:hypothetical protein